MEVEGMKSHCEFCGKKISRYKFITLIETEYGTICDSCFDFDPNILKAKMNKAVLNFNNMVCN